MSKILLPLKCLGLCSRESLFISLKCIQHQIKNNKNLSIIMFGNVWYIYIYIYTTKHVIPIVGYRLTCSANKFLHCENIWSQTHTHTRTHIHIHAHTHTYIHTYTRTHIHTYIYTYIYTYTHTHIYTYTHTIETYGPAPCLQPTNRNI